MEHSEQNKPVTLESMIRSETPPTFHRLRFTPEEARIVQKASSFSRYILDKIFTDEDSVDSVYGHEVAIMDTTNLVDEYGHVLDMELPEAGHVKALGCIVEYYSLQAGINPSESGQLERTAAATLAAELLVKGSPFPDAPPDDIVGA